jgi:lipoate-protein ligase A
MMTHYLEGLKMRYIKFSTYTGAENMQIDSDLLEEAIETQAQEPVFRLYAWKPRCISLGRNQKDDFLQINGVKEDVVRRLTGGRALLHDDEITYSYVAPISIIPDGETISASYKYISSILIDFFRTLGVELDFGGGMPKLTSGHLKGSMKFDYCMLISTGADVCYQGRKIIGSAQYRKQGYILQHGGILFGYDKALLESLFQEEVTNESITTVKDILPDMTKEEFVRLFEEFIKKR